MILQALCNFYDILRDSGVKVPLQGYSDGKISAITQLSRNGELQSVTDFREEGSNRRPRQMEVFEQFQRSGSNAPPYFLSDNAKYVFGIDKGETNIKTFNSFKDFHNQLLSGIDDEEINAFLKFINNNQPEDLIKNPEIVKAQEFFKTGSIIFRIEGHESYLHQNERAKRIWENYYNSSADDTYAQCLVTMERAPIARIHNRIKGVFDAQSTGATIVGFNDAAFNSYGKDQSYNAPISRRAMFSYTTVLNYMLNNPKHHIIVGDATTVFWAESLEGFCEELLSGLLFIENDENEDENDKKGKIEDSETKQLIKDILMKAKNGEKINYAKLDENSNVNFYLLGLAPNNARISVRFFFADTFGSFVEKALNHQLDMNIVSNGKHSHESIPIYRILRETIPINSKEKLPPPILAGQLMTSVLTGTMYPSSVYQKIILRIRAEGIINNVRASFIKAYLLRKSRILKGKLKESEITVSLDENNENTPYRLGRLFAVLEKIQRDALGDNINSTIKDKYFSGASTTPAKIFPIIMRLSQHHIAKLEHKIYYERLKGDILSDIDEFPNYLNLEEQGMFILGYYHQNVEIYRKKKESIGGEKNE